jgi:hypothetical protein
MIKVLQVLTWFVSWSINQLKFLAIYQTIISSYHIIPSRHQEITECVTSAIDGRIYAVSAHCCPAPQGCLKLRPSPTLETSGQKAVVTVGFWHCTGQPRIHSVWVLNCFLYTLSRLEFS